MKIVAFVPIKLKSQRLPNKMMLPLGNQRLCQHIFTTLVEVAEKYSHEIDIYCYCSDESIQTFLPDTVKLLIRSKELDRDETKGLYIYQSFASQVPADIYVLCHATSPFISAKSIISGLNKLVVDGYDSAFAVNEVKTFVWYQGKPLNYNFNNVVRTQDIKPIYWETSAFYIFKSSILMQGRRIGDNSAMVTTDHIESIDIDELKDYQLASHICNNTN